MEVYDIDKFKIGENQDEGDTLSILSKENDLLYCKTLCDFKFNYGDYPMQFTKRSLVGAGINLINLTPSELVIDDMSHNDITINYNNTEYELQNILIKPTYHLKNFNTSNNSALADIEEDGCEPHCNRCFEIFLKHKSKRDEKNLVVCLLVYKYLDNSEINKVNGGNLTPFFEKINNTENNNTFNYTINDLFKSGNPKSSWGNSFYQYNKGKFLSAIEAPTEIEHVIIMKNIFSCSFQTFKNIFTGVDFDEIDAIKENLTYIENPVTISFSLEGTKNSNPKQMEIEYDLVDCQEYSGLDDLVKDNDQLIINEEDKKNKEIEEDGYAVYLIKLLNEYKIYIIAWLIIIFQIILFYYLLKYVYNKWNPNE